MLLNARSLLLAAGAVSAAPGSCPYTPPAAYNPAPASNSTSDRSLHVTRSGTELQLNGKRWTASGANVYWLGLDENVIPPAGEPFYAPYNASYPTHERITEVMNTLNTMGARTIRSQTLGVSVGNPLSLETDLGVFNDKAFDTIDWAIYQAGLHGLRVFAPLTDNYDYYHGGKFVFLRWRGINISSTASPIDPLVQQFYTNETIISDFKDYIKYLVTHVNPYTGLSYAEDPTVLGYETGNELGGPVFGDKDIPAAWVAEIGKFLKEIAPKKLFIDGTYGINATHFEVSEVDIFSDHFYPMNVTKLQEGIAAVETTDRVYFAAEYAWTEANPQGTPLVDFLGAILAQQSKPKPVVSGDHFWSLFMHNAPDCNVYVNHTDGYTLQYNNPANDNATDARIATIRKHLFAMKGQDAGPVALPATPCPGPLSNPTYS